MDLIASNMRRDYLNVFNRLNFSTFKSCMLGDHKTKPKTKRDKTFIGRPF